MKVIFDEFSRLIAIEGDILHVEERLRFLYERRSFINSLGGIDPDANFSKLTDKINTNNKELRRIKKIKENYVKWYK